MASDLGKIEEKEEEEVEIKVKKKSSKVVEPVKSLSLLELDPKVGPIAYRMRPTLADTFKAKVIKHIIQETLYKFLQGKKYHVEEARKWTREIADSVSASVKDLDMPRYKHVVQCTLGQQLGGGCRYIAKCSWDAECDSQTSDVFTNVSLFCVCTVFGIYLY